MLEKLTIRGFKPIQISVDFSFGPSTFYPRAQQ